VRASNGRGVGGFKNTGQGSGGSAEGDAIRCYTIRTGGQVELKGRFSPAVEEVRFRARGLGKSEESIPTHVF